MVQCDQVLCLFIINTPTTVYTNTSLQSISYQCDKTLIRDTILGLSFINKLRSVDYIWNYRGDYLENYKVEKTRIV